MFRQFKALLYSKNNYKSLIIASENIFLKFIKLRRIELPISVIPLIPWCSSVRYHVEMEQIFRRWCKMYCFKGISHSLALRKKIQLHKNSKWSVWNYHVCLYVPSEVVRMPRGENILMLIPKLCHIVLNMLGSEICRVLHSQLTIKRYCTFSV